MENNEKLQKTMKNYRFQTPQIGARPIVVLVSLALYNYINCRFQFHEKFFREKFLPYKFRPHANLEEIARMAEQLDPNTDILSRLEQCWVFLDVKYILTTHHEM